MYWSTLVEREVEVVEIQREIVPAKVYIYGGIEVAERPVVSSKQVVAIAFEQAFGSIHRKTSICKYHKCTCTY